MEIAGGAVGATVQVALQTVLTSILEIISMAKHYKEYLEELKISLEMVQGFLSHVEAKKIGSEAFVKLWLHQLEDLAFEADDVLDAVKYKLLRRQVKNKEPQLRELSGAKRIILKVKMSYEIKDVIKKLKEINERASGFGLQNTIAAESQMRTVGLITPNERETDSFSVETCVEGRGADVEKITEMLITAPQKDKISVIPILGMGGVGKTTVAGTVFNHGNIKNHFGKRIWISVSLNFDAISLFNMILQDLTKKAVKETSKQVVLQKIQEILMNEKDKPYLLILDDVWNEENGKWVDEFMVPLSKISNNLIDGNCIVVTTRKKNVASLVKTLPTHQLRCLSEIQCWSIIKAKAFRGEAVPDEFEEIGLDIAKRCDGLPLAAKVIGGLLHRQTENYWRSILENKLFDGDGDKIMKILRLSYDNLPTLSLKNCFAYCSVFPQDYSIGRQEMTELWIAEGFLQDSQGGDMEKTGSEVFTCLLQYSLFQDEKRDIFGDIVNCKMHDLVHDLACSITNDMNQIRYLALKSADANETNVISQRQEMKYLRTVFFEGKIANNMFSNFKCLHVLKLTLPEIKELPSGIEKLIHLRLLDISSTQVKWLPKSIGELYHLQTLLTSQARYHARLPNMKKLPNTIINLVSLKHLHISPHTALPPFIGQLISLRTLKYYKVRNKKGHRIRELGSLKNLKGELKIGNLEMVKNKKEAEFADLSGKHGIFKLTLEWNESSHRVGDHTNVLDGLQPHPHLKSLEIIGYKGKTLPSWTISMAAPACNNIEIQAFNSLVEITLKGFTQCEELPTLGHLRCLRFLVLENWPKLQRIDLSFYRIDNLSVPKSVFPALERLEMYSMPELTEWQEMREATIVFPCLKYLSIIDCPKLKSVHSHFPCLERLKVKAADCSLTNLFRNTSSLQQIEIKSLWGLDSLPVELFVKNQNLTDLDISYCPKLTRLVPSLLGGGASVKRLSIWCCENLIELPDALCKLGRLSIGECKGLKSIRIELLESCISSLEILKLMNLENLENLNTLIPCVRRMSRLQKFEIVHIPKFKIIPTEIGFLGSLRSFAIGGFSEPMNEDQLITIVQKFPSLKNLGVYRKELHYDTLVEMDSVQHLCLG